MNFVGPRPALYNQDDLKALRTKKGVHTLVPGVTGWAQINQPFDTSVKDVNQKLKYDIYYIENISFKLDLHIAFRTFWVVLRGHKA